MRFFLALWLTSCTDLAYSQISESEQSTQSNSDEPDGKSERGSRKIGGGSRTRGGHGGRKYSGEGFDLSTVEIIAWSIGLCVLCICGVYCYCLISKRIHKATSTADCDKKLDGSGNKSSDEPTKNGEECGENDVEYEGNGDE